ncbi:division control transcriptional repressor DicD [Biostraticola tofi]|uniref:TetR family transcriptional regulator n=1 Tax=Biostraticola tofi TaxID=466109 RepID=A0A4R3Z236_9GAMM|nr:transcriptional regulator [Biostraticola tofi]TCV98977.1 TetR family transcriptional regulator [Biostraticola tofi]
MQREDILDHALNLLEIKGFTLVSLEMLAEELSLPIAQLQAFWPDREALLHDCLRYHADQVDNWRGLLLKDESLDTQQKLLARYQVLDHQVRQQRYPGCLFVAACSFYPDTGHPIHQLAEQQKQASLTYTRDLLTELEADDPTMVAQQMELVLEGCLSKLLVKHQLQDVAVARRLAEDILRLALCRKNGALS